MKITKTSRSKIESEKSSKIEISRQLCSNHPAYHPLSYIPLMPVSHKKRRPSCRWRQHGKRGEKETREDGDRLAGDRLFFWLSHKKRWSSPSRRSPADGEYQIHLIFTVCRWPAKRRPPSCRWSCHIKRGKTRGTHHPNADDGGRQDGRRLAGHRQDGRRFLCDTGITRFFFYWPRRRHNNDRLNGRLILFKQKSYFDILPILPFQKKKVFVYNLEYIIFHF